MQVGGDARAGHGALVHSQVEPLGPRGRAQSRHRLLGQLGQLRWGGDTNFMPAIGHTKVLPQLLGDTRKMLAEAWPVSPSGV